MYASSPPLKIYFLPYISPGHMIPLYEMARLFTALGQHVTIITTTGNAHLLQKNIDKDIASGRNIRLHLVKIPTKEYGLPDGLENFFSVTDLKTADKLYQAMTHMQKDIEDFVINEKPDCIVADMFHPWTTDLAAHIGVPRMVFHAACIFAMCMKDSMRDPDGPHRTVDSDYTPFTVPGLPDPITMTRSQLPDYVRTPNGYTQLVEQWREAEKKSYGVLVNGFEELEVPYTEHYKRIMGHTVWHIGPATHIHRNEGDKADRGHDNVVGEHECLSWLNTKEPDSVLYVCFGSAVRFPDSQLHEIACALQASGVQFIWVILGKDDERDEDKLKWMPPGYEEKVRQENKGMLVRGWAPQLMILDHPAIGGFLTHCGWNSTIEGISAGVPMITWPLYAEQFYNEKLITQVHKIGVEAGVQDWNLWVDVGNKLITRESIEKAVRKVMDGGDEARERRERSRVLGEKARKAIGEGGSSHRNLMALIENLKKLRDSK